MREYEVKALDAATWDDFARLAEYPQDLQGKKISSSFLYDGTRPLFEKAGFSYDRPKGKGHCVMRTTVAPA